LRRIARRSRYKEKLLIREFKKEINKTIRRKFIEIERLFRSIEQ